ncbi:MAG: ATP-binding protein [Ardenticatenaceae bacterium]|nr:ATP-binding protein [Ardenticatenaceae bacterium]MCB9003324.1 ATP-binding protein [Ardenticatenaceae bacterium]
MTIINDLDQRKVAEGVESVGRELLSELPGLSKGQVIIAGTAVTIPVLCQVRPRHTPHGGKSKDAAQIWIRESERR